MKKQSKFNINDIFFVFSKFDDKLLASFSYFYFVFVKLKIVLCAVKNRWKKLIFVLLIILTNCSKQSYTKGFIVLVNSK